MAVEKEERVPRNYRFPKTVLQQLEVMAEIKTDGNNTELLLEAFNEYKAKELQREETQEEIFNRYLNGQIDPEALEALVGTDRAAEMKANRQLLQNSEKVTDKLREGMDLEEGEGDELIGEPIEDASAEAETNG